MVVKFSFGVRTNLKAPRVFQKIAPQLVRSMGDWPLTLDFRRDADTMAAVALELTTQDASRYPPTVTCHHVEFHYKIPLYFYEESIRTAVLPKDSRPSINPGGFYQHLGSQDRKFSKLSLLNKRPK